MNRSISIDILKGIAMFLIVMHHAFLYGFFDLNPALPYTEYYVPVGIFNSLLGPAVDVFVLITGYFLINSDAGRKGLSKAFSKGINLWIEVIFYSAGIALIMLLLQQISISEAWKFLFPMKKDYYWFMSCYIPLLFLSPFLSKLALSLNNKHYLILLSTILVFTTIIQLPCINGGFSLYWFITLFLIGGYVRRFATMSKKTSLLILIVCCIIISALQISKMMIRHSFVYVGYLGFYSGILTITIAVCTLIIFANISIPKKHFTQFLASFTPLTLGIYVIHEHPLLRPFWPTVIDYTYIDSLPFTVNWLMIATIVFLACAAIDLLRRYLFRFLHIDRIGDWITTWGMDFASKYVLHEKPVRN